MFEANYLFEEEEQKIKIIIVPTKNGKYKPKQVLTSGKRLDRLEIVEFSKGEKTKTITLAEKSPRKK